MLHSRQPNPPTETTTKIVLSDSIGNAASAGLGSSLQDYNMICEHVNTSWIKQCSLHASQQKSLMEQPSVSKAAWIRETEEHNFSLWSSVLLSFFQLNQIWSIFKVRPRVWFLFGHKATKSFWDHIQPLLLLTGCSECNETDFKLVISIQSLSFIINKALFLEPIVDY